jgi:hypothetical protein
VIDDRPIVDEKLRGAPGPVRTEIPSVAGVDPPELTDEIPMLYTVFGLRVVKIADLLSCIKGAASSPFRV